MKTFRTSPAMYYIAALLVFVLDVGLSARITGVMASPPVVLQHEKLFFPQDMLVNYLPLLNRADQPTAIIIDHNNRDAAQIPPAMGPGCQAERHLVLRVHLTRHPGVGWC